MAELNFPSMFDTRYAIDRQMQEDAMLAGQTLSDPLGAGMMYASHLSGDMYGQGLMGMASMFGGGDPRMQQQNALDEIMARFPDPQTPEDFVEIANALSGVGLHNYAEKAMDMANETRTSMPAKSNAWKEYTEMTSNPTPEGFQEWYKEFKVTGKTPQTSKQKATENWINSPEYKSGEVNMFDFERTWAAASATPKDPKKQTAEEIDLAEFLVSPEYASGKSTVADWQKNWNLATTVNKSGGQIDADDVALQLVLNSSAYTKGTDLEKTELLLNHNDKFNGGDDRFEYLKNLDDMKKEINPITKNMTADQLALRVTEDNPTGRFFTHGEAMDKLDFIKRKTVGEEIEVATYVENLKSVGELQKEMNLKVDQAYSDQMIHEEMLKAFDIGAKTGFGEDFKLAVNQFGVNFLGLDPSKEMIATEILQSQMKQMTLDRMEKLKGTPSDKDLDLVYAAGATMDKSPEANMIIIGFELFLEQELINRQRFMTNWVSKYKTDNPNKYPSAAQYMAVEDAFRNRNDKSKWNPIAGTESDRLKIVNTFGTNEFTKGREMLANLDIGSDVVQTEISESKILLDKADAAKDVMKQLGY